MSQPIDTATVEIVPDFDRFDNAVDRGITRPLQEVENAVRELSLDIDASFSAAAQSIIDSIDDAADSATRDADRMERAFNNAMNGIQRDAVRTRIELSTIFSGIGGGIGNAGGGITKLIASITKLGIAASGALAAFPPLIAAVGALAEASAGAALLLPAALATGVAIMGTFKIAVASVGEAIGAGLTGDIKKFNKAMEQLPEPTKQFVNEFLKLKPLFDQLKLSVGSRFFEDLAVPVRQLGQSLLPLVTHELSQIAGVMNQVAQESVGFLRTADALGDIRLVLQNATSVSENLLLALRPILEILLDVAAVGSDFLPGLTAGLADAAESAAVFVQELRDSGRLAEIISSGLSFFGDLSNLLVQIGGTISAIFTAASVSGGGFLGTLTQVFTALNGFLSSLEGQTILKSLFSGAQQVISAVIPIVLTLAKSLLPIVSALLPALASGLSALLPAAKPVGEALAALAGALAPILKIAGSVLATALIVLAGVVTTLATALTPLLNLLANAAQQILPLFAGAFLAVVQGGLPNLVILMNALFLALQPLIPIIAQIAQQFIGAIVPAILSFQKTAGEQLLPVLTKLIGELGVSLLSALDSIIPVLPILIESTLQLVIAFLSLFTAIAPLIPFVLQIIVAFIDAANKAHLFEIGVVFLSAVIKTMVVGVNIAIVVLKSVIGVFMLAMNASYNLGAAVGTALRNAFNSLIGIVNTVRNVFNGADDWLYNVGKNIVYGLARGILSLGSYISGIARSVANNAITAAKNALGIRSPSTVFATIGRQTMDGFVEGVIDRKSDVTNTINGAINPTQGAAGTPGASSGAMVTFSPGSVVVSFTGNVPTQEQAYQTGIAVGQGISQVLTNTATRTRVRVT